MKERSITWSVDDFAMQAANRKHPEIYDPERYEYALNIMVDKHDACIGITWDTIDVYLDEYCIKE